MYDKIHYNIKNKKTKKLNIQKTKKKIKKERKRDKRVRNRDPFQGGSHKREVSKHQEILSPAGLWGVLESQKAT